MSQNHTFLVKEGLTVDPIGVDLNGNVNESTDNNFTCGKWELTVEENEFQQLHGYWVQSVASIVVCICGTIVNIITILILSNVELKRLFFNKLLICLTVFDILYLINSIYESLRLRDAYGYEGTDYCALQGHVLLILHPFRKIVMCCSIYMTLVLTCERYLAVAKPITHRQRSIGSSEGKRTLKYVSPVILFSILYCMPHFFSSMIIPVYPEGGHQTQNISNTSSINELNETISNVSSSSNMENHTLYCLRPTEIRLSKYYILWYVNVANFVVTGAIPFISLAVLNCKIYQIIQKSQKESLQLMTSRAMSTINGNTQHQKTQKAEERRQAIVLFGIVIAFFLCHILRIIVNIEEIITYDDWEKTEERAEKAERYCDGVQFWTMITTDYSFLLLQINASINFFIYCFFSKQFQKVLKDQLLRLGKYLRLVNVQRWGSESTFGSRRGSFAREHFISTRPSGQTLTTCIASTSRSRDNFVNENCGHTAARPKTTRAEVIELQAFDQS